MVTTSLTEAAKIYYSKFFSFEPMFKVIPIKTFHLREFGFTVSSNEELRFIRNISFKNPSELKKFLLERNVVGAYIGAVYTEGPTPKNPISKENWIGRELVIDLDLTDYDDIRTCGKGKDHYCPKCWPLITNAALFIDETLREDFGFEKITWVYSGRRGLHAWVHDENAFHLGELEREAIADYINMSQHGFYPIKYRERALKIYGKEYQVNMIDPKQQKIMLKKIWSKIVEKLPRIDKKVTMDTVRLLRMPGSIHDSTGRIVTIIKDIETFYPDQIPNVWEITGLEKPKIKFRKND